MGQPKAMQPHIPLPSHPNRVPPNPNSNQIPTKNKINLNVPIVSKTICSECSIRSHRTQARAPATARTRVLPQPLVFCDSSSNEMFMCRNLADPRHHPHPGSLGSGEDFLIFGEKKKNVIPCSPAHPLRGSSRIIVTRPNMGLTV